MNERELQIQMQLLLEDAAKRRTYGERALMLMQRDKDMAERYAQHINRYCDLGELNHRL